MKKKILSRLPEYPAKKLPPPEEKFRDVLFWDPQRLRLFSRATGDYRIFETLYRIHGGRWVVRQCIRRPGRRSYRWFEVSEEEARAWLERCGYGQTATRRCVFCGSVDGLKVPYLENVCVSCITNITNTTRLGGESPAGPQA